MKYIKIFNLKNLQKYINDIYDIPMATMAKNVAKLIFLLWFLEILGIFEK